MEKEHKSEIFQRFLENPSLKSERETFEKIFGKTIWSFVASEQLELSQKDLCECEHVASGKSKKPACIPVLKEAVSVSRKTKSPKIFECSHGLSAISLPLVQGDKFYGFILICHIKKKPTPETVTLLMSFTQSVLREVQKERELSKLYDSIRPRAIALSTVHTVHRLISSTLNIDELLRPKRIGF